MSLPATDAYHAGLDRIAALMGPAQATAIDALGGLTPMTARAVATCFGEIYGDASPLELKTRELITVAVVATLGHAAPQLQAHLRGALNAGASHAEILATLDQLYAYAGMPTALNAIAVARDILSTHQEQTLS